MSSNEFTARKVTPLTVTNPADAVEMSVVAVCAKLANDSAVKPELPELDDPAEMPELPELPELGAAVELDDVCRDHRRDLVDVDDPSAVCLSCSLLATLIGAGFNLAR